MKENKNSNEIAINAKRHQCNSCKRTFCGKYSLQTHIKAVHLNYRPNKCELCEHRTFNKSDLDRHMKVHNKQVVPLSQNVKYFFYLLKFINNLFCFKNFVKFPT